MRLGARDRLRDSTEGERKKQGALVKREQEEAGRPGTSVHITALPKLTPKSASLMQLQLKLSPIYLCMMPFISTFPASRFLTADLPLWAVTQSSQRRQMKWENVGAGKIKKVISSSKHSFKLWFRLCRLIWAVSSRTNRDLRHCCLAVEAPCLK